jgi:hypothetical protein
MPPTQITSRMTKLIVVALILVSVAALLIKVTRVKAATGVIAYYDFEGAATSPFPVNATSHAPAFFDGSDPQHTSTLVPTNLSTADMRVVSPGLPINQIVSSNATALGFSKTFSHSPADLDMPLPSSGQFQDMTVSFAISGNGNGYAFYQ